MGTTTLAQTVKQVPSPSVIRVHTFAIIVLFLLVVVGLVLHFVPIHHQHEHYNNPTPPSIPNGWTIQCNGGQNQLYQYNQGQRYMYRNEKVAASCNPNWNMQLGSVDCSQIPEGPTQNIPCPPPSQPGGVTLLTSAPTPPTTPAPTTPPHTPRSFSGIPNLQNGASIYCTQDKGTPQEGAVYQYNNGTRYWYNNIPVASSCNPNWSSNIQTVNCAKISEGPVQTSPCNPPAPPGGVTLITG